MGKITYTNKVALNENPEIADINKVTDDDMNEIKSVVNTNDDNVGDITTLTTTTKTSTVSAINELNSTKATSNDLGNIANLTTTDKTSVVNAVNELNSDKASKNEVIISDTQPSASDNKLWIDTGEIGSAVSEITNEYSTSTGIGYSANYVNNLHTYSETEQRIGTWIDGKPIYRKVVRNIIPTGVGISVYNDNNIESVIHYYGLYNQNNVKFLKQINFWFSNTDYMTLNYSKNNKSFILDNTSQYNNNGTVDLIIEYTKTTD